MPVNPCQRKEYSLEKLNILRDKVRQSYLKNKEEELQTPNNKKNIYYSYLIDDIFLITKKEISSGTLLKFFYDDNNRWYQVIIIGTIEEYVYKSLPSDDVVKDKSNSDNNTKNIKEKNKYLKKIAKTTTIKNWSASTNFSSPQWADYFKIPIENGFIKRVRCQILTTSEYYRFGFKLFRNNGKLFGDGSIQSMDNNFVIHIGKNFLSDELFITTYHNGILQRPGKNINVKPLNNKIKIELFIDNENFLCLFLDGKEVFKIIINNEIREQIYMLAWGDVYEYQLRVENIEIEYEIG